MIEKKQMNEEIKLVRRQLTIPLPLVAFFLTATLLVALFAVIGYAPFGKYTVLASDLLAQYAPDLIAYKNKLLAGGNLQYSSMLSLGKNTLGLFSYYLSSPFNFITFLFPTTMISEAVLTLILLKLSLASATMTLFLGKRHQSKSRFVIVFGVMYAFCTYAFVFMMNIMWLDGFYILPLLIYFIEQFIENKAYWKRLVFILVLLFVSGFYIAYMVGLFSFFYLVFRLLEENRFSGEDKKLAWKRLGSYVGIAIISAMISATLLIPAGLDILRNPDYYQKEAEFATNFTFLEFLNQLPAGSFDSIAANKPLIYCGICVFFLCILFFLNPTIAFRKKAVTGAAILSLLLSFSVSTLNLAWHLFDNPNWFLYRYSFLLSFVLLSTAFNSFLNIKGLKRKAFITSGLWFLLLLLLVQGFGDLRDEGLRFYFNLGIGLIELFCLYHLATGAFPKSIENLKPFVPGFLAFILCLEASIFNPLALRPKIMDGEYMQEKVYNPLVQELMLVNDAKEDAKKDKVSFFRMETIANGDGIDPISAPLFLNYNGTSTFNSSSNKPLNRLLKQFGYYTNYNYFASEHNYTSIVIDSLLGIRYILVGEGSQYGYEMITKSEDGSDILLKNDTALPIMYTLTPEAASFDMYFLEKNPGEKDPFAFQNRYLEAVFGQDAFRDPVYKKIEVEAPSVFNGIVAESTGIEEDDSDTSQSIANSDSLSSLSFDDDLLGEEPLGPNALYNSTYLRMNDKASMKIIYSVTIPDDNPVYFSVITSGRNGSAEILVDKKPVASISESFYSSIFGIGDRKAGDTVTLEIRCEEDTFPMIETLFYSCDTALFKEQLKSANPSGQVMIEHVEDGFIKATVNADKDSLVFTSIPYETGWTLLLDGKPADVIPYHDAFVSIPVSAGQHTIELAFHAPGLNLGIAVSCMGIVVFMIAAGIDLWKRKKT